MDDSLSHRVSRQHRRTAGREINTKRIISTWQLLSRHVSVSLRQNLWMPNLHVDFLFPLSSLLISFHTQSPRQTCRRQILRFGDTQCDECWRWKTTPTEIHQWKSGSIRVFTTRMQEAKQCFFIPTLPSGWIYGAVFWRSCTFASQLLVLQPDQPRQLASTNNQHSVAFKKNIINY